MNVPPRAGSLPESAATKAELRRKSLVICGGRGEEHSVLDWNRGAVLSEQHWRITVVKEMVVLKDYREVT